VTCFGLARARTHNGQEFHVQTREFYSPDDELLSSLGITSDDDDDDGDDGDDTKPALDQLLAQLRIKNQAACKSNDTNTTAAQQQQQQQHGSAGEPEDLVKISNPLNWFGIIVPSALREAQSDFTSSMCVIITIKLLLQSVLMWPLVL
jgi:hypothetical protein